MTQVCRVCGAVAQDGRCTLCGSNRLEDAPHPSVHAPAPSTPLAQPRSGPAAPSAGTAGRQRRPLIVGGAIVGLAVVGLIGWLVSTNAGRPSAAGPAPARPIATAAAAATTAATPVPDALTTPAAPPAAPVAAGEQPEGEFEGDLVQSGATTKTWYAQTTFAGDTGDITYSNDDVTCRGTLARHEATWVETITSGPCTGSGTWTFTLSGDTLAGSYAPDAGSYGVSGILHRVTTLPSDPPGAADPPASYPVVRVSAGKECSREGSGPYAASGTSNSTTSCPFAINVRRAYLETLNGRDGMVRAYSPTTKLWYDMECSGDQPVLCTGGRAGRVIIYGGDLRVG